MNRCHAWAIALSFVMAAGCSSTGGSKGNGSGSGNGNSGGSGSNGTGGSGNGSGGASGGNNGNSGNGGNGSGNGGTSSGTSGSGSTGGSGSSPSGSSGGGGSGAAPTGDGGAETTNNPGTGGACKSAPAATNACTGGATGSIGGTVGAGNSCWGPGTITLTGAVTVPSGTTLTINPGTTINGAGPVTAMGGTIKAMGAASAPIFFLDTSLALVGGTDTFQYTIINSAGATAIDDGGAQVTISHVQIQKFSAVGLAIHGAGAKATVDFSTMGTTATLFSTGPNGTPTPPAVAVTIDATAAAGGTSITNSSLGFLQDALNNGLQEAGTTSTTHLAYDFISGTANTIVTTDNKTGVFNAAPGIADIPNLNHNLGYYAPALDLADPTADYSQEPAPNGGRANIGYYGGTSCATQTTVQMVSPDGCETYNGGSMQTVTWHASPDTPAPGSKTLSFSSDNGKTWSTLASIPAGNDPNTAMVTFPQVTSDQCLMKISQDNDPNDITSTSQNVFAVGMAENEAACQVKPRCPAGTTGCKPYLAICYEGYRDGQAPGGTEPTCDEVQQDLNIISPFTQGIRTYGSSPLDHDGMCIPGIADSLGLDFHMGVWVDNTYTDAQNYAAIDASVGIVCGQPSANGCPNGPSAHKSIKTVIVGNEFLLRVRQSFGDTQAAEVRLVSYIKYARARVPSTIEVVTAESYPDWLTASVNLYNAVDRIVWHSHPWWEQIPIAQAASHFASTHDLMTAQMKTYGITKPERCGETGWPWDVNNGAAVGSEANQSQYLHDLNAYSAQVGLQYWFFEGFDEAWKSAEGPVGGKWGQWMATRPATGSDDTAGQHLVITNIATEVPATTEWPPQ